MTLLFIPSLLTGDYRTFFIKLALVAMFWVFVIIATLIDLKSGISASKAKGKFRTTSSGLRQTGKKILEYMAIMLFALMLDFALSYFSSLSDTIGFLSIFKVPICSLLGLIGVIITEWISVNENVRKKKGTDIIPHQTVELVADLISVVGEDKLKALATLIKEKEAAK